MKGAARRLPLGGALCRFLLTRCATPAQDFGAALLQMLLADPYDRPQPIPASTLLQLPGTKGRTDVCADHRRALKAIGLIEDNGYRPPSGRGTRDGECRQFRATILALGLHFEDPKRYPSILAYLNRNPAKGCRGPLIDDQWPPDLLNALRHIRENPLLHFDTNRAYQLATALSDDRKVYGALQSMAAIPDGPVWLGFSEAKSGRIQTKSPNLQAVSKPLRSAVTSLRGNLLAYADFAQAEPRVLGCLSEDEHLIADLGQPDFYQVVQEFLTLPDRDTTKRAVNAIFNGRGAWGLAEELFGECKKSQYDEARRLIDLFWNRYRTAAKWRESLIYRIVEDGYAETVGGRRRELRKEFEEEGRECSSHAKIAWAERKGVSHVIQGSFADSFRRTLVELHNAGFRIALPLHDAILFEVRDAREAEDGATLMTETAKAALRGTDYPVKVNGPEQSWHT